MVQLARCQRVLLLAVSAAAVCTPEEVLQALRCFDFQEEENINTYSEELLDFCEAMRAERGGCVPQLACRCLGEFLEIGRQVRSDLADLKNHLETNISRLRNFTDRATRWQLHMRPGSPGSGRAHEARLAFWKKFMPLKRSLHWTGSLGATIADDLAPDIVGLAKMGSELLDYAKTKSRQSVYELQLSHGNGCIVNIFHETCDKPHFRIFHAFPPVHGPATEERFLDFLGISNPVEGHCYETQLALYAPSRSFECLWLHQNVPLPRFWPILDEEYLEWADILSSSFDAASHRRSFRMADIGSGAYGLWAARAAKAFLRHAEPWQGCKLLLVEPFELGDHSVLQSHLAWNFPEGRCNFVVHEEMLKSSEQLKALLDGEPWDLVDIDAQGYEHPLLKGLASWLLGRVRRLHISTHDRWKHWEIIGWLKDAGWHVPVHYPTLSTSGMTSIGLENFLNADGHITAVLPTLAWS